jgi:hypothetical protein
VIITQCLALQQGPCSAKWGDQAGTAVELFDGSTCGRHGVIGPAAGALRWGARDICCVCCGRQCCHWQVGSCPVG